MANADQAHDVAETARGEAERVRVAIAEELDWLASEFKTVTIRLELELELELERDEAYKEVHKANEEAATLRGRVEGLELAISLANQRNDAQKKTD